MVTVTGWGVDLKYSRFHQPGSFQINISSSSISQINTSAGIPFRSEWVSKSQQPSWWPCCSLSFPMFLSRNLAASASLFSNSALTTWMFRDAPQLEDDMVIGDIFYREILQGKPNISLKMTLGDICWHDFCLLVSKLFYNISRWWFQPIWKICSSNGFIFTHFRGEKKKYQTQAYIIYTYIKIMYLHINRYIHIRMLPPLSSSHHQDYCIFRLKDSEDQIPSMCHNCILGGGNSYPDIVYGCFQK